MDIVYVAVLIMAFSSVSLLVYVGLNGGYAKFTSLLQLKAKEGEEQLRDLFISNITPREVAIYSYLGAIVTGFMLWLIIGHPLIGILGGIGGLFAPKAVFAHLKEKRIEKIDEQLPEALEQMVSSAKSGLSLAQAIEHVARNAPKPVSQEFDLIVRDYRMGTDLTSAINTARTRLGSKLFGLAASTLIVNIEKGGNLPQALKTLSESMKEIARLEQKLITSSAEGRKAIKVIAAMPFGIFVMVATVQPELIDTLTGSLGGYVLITVAILMYAGAIYWLKKILAVEV